MPSVRSAAVQLYSIPREKDIVGLQTVKETGYVHIRIQDQLLITVIKRLRVTFHRWRQRMETPEKYRQTGHQSSWDRDSKHWSSLGGDIWSGVHHCDYCILRSIEIQCYLVLRNVHHVHRDNLNQISGYARGVVSITMSVGECSLILTWWGMFRVSSGELH